ncbi:MAG: gamma-glutamyl-gamma-aminobutyrate hydrolase family protein [Anaerolineaceae bacterium]|nr:gamma-glutamyl-gamma-aminobutyrate hydrolase family protein [Anaerolineaceae bacterium]
MGKPIIGITSSRVFENPVKPGSEVNQDYSNAVLMAGGIPFNLPVGLYDDDFPQIFETLDGLILSGGVDMDPNTYGDFMHPSIPTVDTDRDRQEIAMVNYVVEKKIPFLGICRGAQVVNVALGGTLYSHVIEQHPGAFRHDCYPGFPRDYLAHTIEIDEGSLLFDLIGNTSTKVNSFHHQGLKMIADSIIPTGYAPDGLVESANLKDHPFGLIVQWHPENLQAYQDMQALFKGLISAA